MLRNPERMPRPLRGVVLALVASVSLLMVSPASAGSPTRFERALLSAINQARAAQGLHRVRFAQPLQTRSHRYAVRLIRTDQFRHAGNLPAYTNENLAWGTTGIMGPRRIVRMWLLSPGHRANLLWRGARRAGVGVARGEFRGYSDVRVAVARLAR
jgi:uncharacterized protein YkwD